MKKERYFCSECAHSFYGDNSVRGQISTIRYCRLKSKINYGTGNVECKECGFLNAEGFCNEFEDMN